MSQAAEYPGAREPISFKPITDDDRLVYFAKYTNVSLGRVKNLYLDWARVTGPMSSQCQELNRLFSTCVDGNMIKVPPRLEKTPPLPEDSPPFVLDELHEAAKNTIKNWKWRGVRTSAESEISPTAGLECEAYSLETLELLLSRDDLMVNEFELIQLTQKWCRAQQSKYRFNASFESFLSFFDFNLLTAEQRLWVLGQLPPTEAYPRLVQNALNQSQILDTCDLVGSGLDHSGLRWKRLYSSLEQGRTGGFMEAVSKALELFHKKLIMYRVDDRLTLGIYIPKRLPKSKDCKVDGSIRLLAFPHSKDKNTSSRLVVSTKVGYQLYYDEHSFQLFESQRANSWVYITKGASDDSSYRGVESVGDMRRARQKTLDEGVNFDFRTSVALDKFSRGLQTHIGRVRRNGVLSAVSPGRLIRCPVRTRSSGVLFVYVHRLTPYCGD